MGFISTIFRDDIVLDQEAFKQASDDFAALKTRLQNLENAIEEMLTTLEKGFDTPAGRQFVKSCRDNLEAPMRDQEAVLDHISTTLTEVRKLYAKVFDEYTSLNSKLSSYSNN